MICIKWPNYFSIVQNEIKSFSSFYQFIFDLIKTTREVPFLSKLIYFYQNIMFFLFVIIILYMLRKKPFSYKNYLKNKKKDCFNIIFIFRKVNLWNKSFVNGFRKLLDITSNILEFVFVTHRKFYFIFVNMENTSNFEYEYSVC